MSDQRIKLFLLTGFLGAGKTTLLKRLIDHYRDHKIGILMNEFGNISIDGVILRQHGVEVVEINNGSVFCSCLKGTFINELIAYSELPIEYLFVETSGMADPSNIEQILDGIIGKVKGKSYDYRGAICLVDGVNFLDQVEVLAALERQVNASNLIVINKVDLISREELTAVRNKVGEINPEVEIVEVTHGAVDFTILEKSLRPAAAKDLGESYNNPFNRPTAHIVTAQGVYNRELFMEYVNDLIPQALRMKGFVLFEEGWHQIDVVGAQVVVEPTAIPRDISELVVISDKGFGALTAIYGHWDKRFSAQQMTVK
jgi:G3E family GTPase